MTAPQNSAGAPVLRLLIDLSAAVVLCVILAGVYAFDREKAVGDDGSAGLEPPPLPVDPPPDEPGALDITSFLPPVDPEPRIKVSGWTFDGHFGVMTTTGDPSDPNDDNKKLTYSENGISNNTRVWVDGATPSFGSNEGVWHERIGRRADGRLTCAWDYKGVRFEQIVELIPGEVSRRMDTLRITYTMTNLSNRSPVVGVRVMIDALIGGNDGVPYLAPTRADTIIAQPTVFTGAEVPPFLHAMQNPDTNNPGVVVRIAGLQPTVGEAPTEVVLSHFPGFEAPWEYDRKAPFGGDTAVGVYYARQPLESNKKRSVSFTYGLATQSRGKLLTLTPGQAPKAGGAFYLSSLVQPPKEGQTVTLDLPEGMKLKDAAKKTQSVREQGAYQQINWLVAVDRNALGSLRAHVRLEPDGKEAEAVLNVQPADSRLFLKAQPPKSGERGIWVSGFVHSPKEGQTLELQVAGVAGVALHPNHPAIKKVPSPKRGEYGRVLWWLTVDASASGTVDLTAILHGGDGEKPLQDRTRVSVERGSLLK